MADPVALKATPLNQIHRSLKAKMVDFGGWDMPVQYSGIVQEHNAVRTSVGLFDVSHMGEIEIRGPEALDLVNYISSNDATKLKNGQAHYSGLLYDHGGFVDDILVHRVDDDHFFLCVNASNQDKDFDHITLQNRFKATVEFASDRYAQLAIQGPKALPALQKLTTTKLDDIHYYHFVDGEVGGVWARIARTGYTGEDGFEIYVDAAEAEPTWERVMAAGSEFGLIPCGLGARNTLRLEAKMALYGHEIDASISPYEADLGWIVKLSKPDFVGKTALEKQKGEGIKRKVVGFEMLGRGIGRDGYEVWIDRAPAGWVTSGGPSPTLGKNIGLAMLPLEAAEPGHKIQIMIRKEPVEAVTVPTPFYKRSS
ncbi:MAG TPA: glycine cleavage system aminomethyltransferase GcvT [Bryobacteraceae bacterium]|jgi:aminomethyltransferase|nr:glycine cleavage system aminomethyltransferase GcvT [Bryobacteraceae bacterium]